MWRSDTGELDPVPAEAGTPVDPEELRYAPRPPRRFTWLRRVLVLAVIGVLVWLGASAAYAWTQKQYYVAPDGGTVAIYRGVQAQVPGGPAPPRLPAEPGQDGRPPRLHPGPGPRRHRCPQPRGRPQHRGPAPEPRRRAPPRPRHRRPSASASPSGTATKQASPRPSASGTRKPTASEVGPPDHPPAAPRPPARPRRRPTTATPRHETTPRFARASAGTPDEQRRQRGLVHGVRAPPAAGRGALLADPVADRGHRRLRRGRARHRGQGAGRHRRLRRLAGRADHRLPRHDPLHRAVRRPGAAAGGLRAQRARPGDDPPDRPRRRGQQPRTPTPTPARS